MGGGITNWADAPKSNESKRQAKLVTSYSLAAGTMLALSFIATNPITGFIVTGIGLVNSMLGERAANAYKLAKIDGLLAKEDVDELMAIIGENKKLQAKLSTYDKNVQVRDLPEDLRKQCYQAIVKQYIAARNLKIAIQEAKAG